MDVLSPKNWSLEGLAVGASVGAMAGSVTGGAAGYQAYAKREQRLGVSQRWGNPGNFTWETWGFHQQTCRIYMSLAMTDLELLENEVNPFKQKTGGKNDDSPSDLGISYQTNPYIYNYIYSMVQNL